MTEQQHTDLPIGPDGPMAPPDAGPEPKVIDYFAFSVTERHVLPDGVQWFEFAAMNEGAKRKYQQKTSSDFIVDRRSGDTKVRIDPGTERRILIEESVTNFHLLRGGQPVQFNKIQLSDFLELADPTVVEGLEKAIREVNPWLLDNVSSEDIEKQIEQLEEQLVKVKEREAGEAH